MKSLNLFIATIALIVALWSWFLQSKIRAERIEIERRYHLEGQ